MHTNWFREALFGLEKKEPGGQMVECCLAHPLVSILIGELTSNMIYLLHKKTNERIFIHTHQQIVITTISLIISA